MPSKRSRPHPAYLLTLVFALTAVVLLLYIEEVIPFQDLLVERARAANWTSWLAHTAVVLGLAGLWRVFGGDLWGGAVFANALNLGHEAGQKIYGNSEWANLDTLMDLLLPLVVSVAVAAWVHGPPIGRGRAPEGEGSGGSAE